MNAKLAKSLAKKRQKRILQFPIVQATLRIIFDRIEQAASRGESELKLYEHATEDRAIMGYILSEEDAIIAALEQLDYQAKMHTECPLSLPHSYPQYKILYISW
jgi:hypothetical protein